MSLLKSALDATGTNAAKAMKAGVMSRAVPGAVNVKFKSSPMPKSRSINSTGQAFGAVAGSAWGAATGAAIGGMYGNDGPSFGGAIKGGIAGGLMGGAMGVGIPMGAKAALANDKFMSHAGSYSDSLVTLGKSLNTNEGRKAMFASGGMLGGGAVAAFSSNKSNNKKRGFNQNRGSRIN